jgi:FAD/FMN-containing dehydrogenase
MISRRKLLGAGAGTLSLLAVDPLPVRAGGPPWERLGRHLRGRLVLPSDPFYATAKQLDLAQFDRVDPRAVAYCVGREDVAVCLKFAQDHALPFSVRSGGHSFGGFSTSRGLVVDVSRLDGVSVGRKGVRVGCGAQAVDVLNALAPAGLVLPGGARATVAAGGFVQGGGIGYLSRTLGLACDRVTSARVVLADGTAVTASPGEHDDLYWAVRGGGGGNFGVVTSFTMTPAKLNLVRMAALSWDWDDAADTFDGFCHWLVDAPREIGAAAVAVLGDAAPGSVPFAGLILLSTGSAERLATEVERLTSMTGPPSDRYTDTIAHRQFMMDTFGCGELAVPQCHRIGATPGGALPRAAFGLVRGRMFAHPMPRSAWHRALAVFDEARIAGQTHKLEVLALGGAASDPHRTDTAYVHRDTLFDANYLSVVYDTPVSAEASAAARHWVDAGFTAVDPHSNGETYQNFIDPSLPGWQHAYYAENLPRLRTVKDRYDPHRAFRFPQGIH